MGSFKNNINKCLSFVYLLRIEPYLILTLFATSIKRVPLDQLIQDKICLQKYNLSKEFCYNLPQMDSSAANYSYKSLILSDSSEFSFFHALISTLPSIVWSLFIGSWTDRYINAKWILLLLAGLASSIESLLILLSCIKFHSSNLINTSVCFFKKIIFKVSICY